MGRARRRAREAPAPGRPNWCCRQALPGLRQGGAGLSRRKVSARPGAVASDPGLRQRHRLLRRLVTLRKGKGRSEWPGHQRDAALLNRLEEWLRRPYLGEVPWLIRQPRLTFDPRAVPGPFTAASRRVGAKTLEVLRRASIRATAGPPILAGIGNCFSSATPASPRGRLWQVGYCPRISGCR